MTKIDHNTKYCFHVVFAGNSHESDEYENKLDAIEAMCQYLRENPAYVWAQFIAHHYADQFYDEYREVDFTMSNN